MSSHKQGHTWSHKKRGKLHKALKWVTSQFKNKEPRELAKNIVLALIACGLFGIVFLFLLMAWYSRDLPKAGQIIDRDVPQSTKIYDRTGEVLLYEIAGDEKRTLTTLEQIPDFIEHATLTAEDRKFYKHPGFDAKGLSRAIICRLPLVCGGRVAGGGSTITQQLIKNAILTNDQTITRKMKEILLSIAMERRFSKDEILELYLNEIPYGSTNYGIESASQAYFQKHVTDLTLAEGATLVALPQAPSSYINNPDRLKARRDWILTDMEKLGYISAEERDAALASETPVNVSLSGIKAPHYVLWVKEQLEETYGERMVEQGGLKVITTLDWEKQQIAEKAVADNKAAYGESYQFNNSGLVAIDPKNGQVVALVGSADYFDNEIDGQVNVTNRRLQPGSSIKPIIYAAGFEAGYTPNTILWDVETNFPSSAGNYRPRNYNLQELGPVTIRKALQGSLNIPAVKMLALIGVENGLNFAERLGYTFENRDQYGLAVVLGGAEVKLIEHTAAYAVFANGGVKHETAMILKVESAKGEVLEEWKESEGERVLDANIAYMMSNVLSDDAARAYTFGAGSNLTLPGRPVAAKTGTTNDYKDAWTMGYTPSLVAGVWTGNTDGTRMNSAGGSRAAAPIWNAFMRGALAGTPAEGFPSASIPVTGKPVLDGQMPTQVITIDTVSGKLATEFTPEEYKQEKACGEYHSILHYVNPSSPRGPAPANPERNGMYASWENAIAAYITKKNETLDPGEVPMEACEIPTEYDDVHTPENTPVVRIDAPRSGAQVIETIELDIDAEARRDAQRIEVYLDGALIDSRSYRNRFTVDIPTWVSTGDQELSVHVIDDVGNRGEAEITVNVERTGETASVYRLTNPVNRQIIRAENPTYTVVAEQSGSPAVALTITATNTQTGLVETVASIANPGPIVQAEWTLAPGTYLIEVFSTYADLGVISGRPSFVIVQVPASPPPLEGEPADSEESE